MKINPLLFVQKFWVMLVSITKVPLKKLVLCSVLICYVIKKARNLTLSVDNTEEKQ